MKVYYKDMYDSMLCLSVDKVDRIEFVSKGESVDFANIPRKIKSDSEIMDLKEENKMQSVFIKDLQDEIRGLKRELDSKENGMKTKMIDMESSDAIILGKDKEIERLHYELNFCRNSLSATTKEYRELKQKNDDFKAMVNEYLNSESMSI